MAGMQAYIQALLVTNPLIEPIVRGTIGALEFPLASCGLDAGCGIGLQTMQLAEAVGPVGHITGLDLSPELLSYARGLVEKAGLTERIAFEEGDVRSLPFDEDSFDWAWSKDCVGYAPLEPLPLLKELARVVKPGGVVAILAWSSQVLLPGYPLLEARLNATSVGMAPFAMDKKAELHFLRGLGWYREAGLIKGTAQTFINQVYAPLSDEVSRALRALLEMRWSGVEPELSLEDRAEYQRLCLPSSPDFIVDHPDYYAFFTYSMFFGKVG
jgi:ubiquinone/menaquinone biosynthesis C-methylase UbiE